MLIKYLLIHFLKYVNQVPINPLPKYVNQVPINPPSNTC